MCRLCMARGLNEKNTRPLMIEVIDKGSMADNVKAKVIAHELDENMMRYIDEPIDYSKHFKKEDLPGPIVWEKKRNEKDKYFVETNCYIALLDSHSNCQLLTSDDQAAPVEDYLVDYVTKESERKMKGACSIMLASMNHVQEKKSKAEDAGTELRDSKFFATRTINSIQGGTEQEIKIMIAAIIGMKSHVTSEKFRYIFPKDSVSFIDKRLDSMK